MNEIRVRFAPSPTGTLHIGGARTALFNWLFARKHGGKFILRLEDTDTARSSLDSARGIVEGLLWLGLDWDEGPEKGGAYGPYLQSERLPIYKKYLEQLLEEDKAYYCFCSSAELQAQRELARQNKTDYKYSGCCCNLDAAMVKEKLDSGARPVVRLRVPESGATVVNDLIRGPVSFSNQLLDDFIIAKADGWPTYNFAVVVDDYTMRISHVIRAEEHLSNTPRQILIYQALGWELPQFAHVSMILAPDRSKLSKRHGATSVQEFREQGYLPEALLNYLGLLGWSTGEDVDYMTVAEMIEKFDLADASLSPAIYDIQKLAWMNGHYLSAINLERIVELLESEACQRGCLTAENREYFTRVVDLLRSRARQVDDILEQGEYFFTEVLTYDAKGVERHFKKPGAAALLTELLSQWSNLADFRAEHLETCLRQLAEQKGIKAAELIHPVRLALTGRTATPGLFEIMEVLGREKCLERIKKAVVYMGAL